MYQAITTKFLAPTNHKGARIKASADAGHVTVDWDYSLNVEGNHKAAAKALVSHLGWSGVWHGGALPGTGYAFVCQAEASDAFTAS